MKIVHVITGLQSGGAEGQLQSLILNSDPTRVTHAVISLDDASSAIAQELRLAGISVCGLGLHDASNIISRFSQLVRLLRGMQPDVLHCWMYHACLLGSSASAFAKVPRIVWSIRAGHSGLRDYSFSTRLVIRLCALGSRIPDVLVVNSNCAANAHQFLGYHTARMKVIPNGVNTSQFHPNTGARQKIREELGLSPDALLIGLLSRFDPMKDHSTFLEAAHLVKANLPRSHFVLAGRNIDATNRDLVSLVAKYGLRSSVSLMGERRDIPILTAALDTACLSSWTESFPNTLIEAMSCGVPCVTTSAGDASDIIGETGRVVPTRDPRSLASAICEIAGLSLTAREYLGTSARRRAVREFSVERFVRAHEEAYGCSAIAQSWNRQPQFSSR